MASTQTSVPDSGKFTFQITRILRHTLPVLKFFRATEEIQKEISKINWAKHLDIPSQFRLIVHRAWDRVKTAPNPASRSGGAIMKRIPFPTRQQYTESKILPREAEESWEEQGPSKRRMANNDHCTLRWNIEPDGTVGVTSVPVEEALEIILDPNAETEWIGKLEEARANYADHVISFTQGGTGIPYEDARRVRNKTFSQLVPSKRPSNSSSLLPHEIRAWNTRGKHNTIRKAMYTLLEAMEKGTLHTDLSFTSLSDAQFRFWELCRSNVQRTQPSLSAAVNLHEPERLDSPQDPTTNSSAQPIADAPHEADEAEDATGQGQQLTSSAATTVQPSSTHLNPDQLTDPPTEQAEEPQPPPLIQSEHLTIEAKSKDDQDPVTEDTQSGPNTPKIFKVPSGSCMSTEDETAVEDQKNQDNSAQTTAAPLSSPAQHSGPIPSGHEQGALTPELLTTPIRVHLLQHEQQSPSEIRRLSSPIIPRSAFAKRQSLEFGNTSDSFGAGSPSWTRNPAFSAAGRVTKAFNRSRRRQSMPRRSVIRATASRKSASPTKTVTFEDDDSTIGLTQRLRFDQSIVQHASPDPIVAAPEVDHAITSSPTAPQVRNSSSSPLMNGPSSVARPQSPTPGPITPAPAQGSKLTRGPPAPTPRELRVVDVDARQQLFLFGTPIKATNTPNPIEKLAQVVEELQSHAKIALKQEHGRLIVRFKIPAEHAHLFPPSQGDDESNFSASQLTTGSPANQRPSRSGEIGLEDMFRGVDFNSGLRNESPSRFNDSFTTPNITMRDTTRSRRQQQRTSSGAGFSRSGDSIPQSNSSLPSFREFTMDPATPTYLQGGFESPYPDCSATKSAPSAADPSDNLERGTPQRPSPLKHQLLSVPSSVRTPRFRPSLAPPQSSPACPYTDGPTLIVPDFAPSPSIEKEETHKDSPGAQLANEIDYYSPKKTDSIGKSSGLSEPPPSISTPSHWTNDRTEEASSMYTTANEQFSKISLGQLSPDHLSPAKLPSVEQAVLEDSGLNSPKAPSTSDEAVSITEAAKDVSTEADAPATPQACNMEDALTQQEQAASTPITFTPVNQSGKTATPSHSEPEQVRTNVYQMTQEEIEQRDYMSGFLSRHRENSRNKRSNTTETGSPVATKRQPLGVKSPNTPSPARVKRKADELEGDNSSPRKERDRPQSPRKSLEQSPKRNRRTAKTKSKASKAQEEQIIARGPPPSTMDEDDVGADELADDASASSRRSKRLKTSAPKSSIPTAIKVGRAGSVLKGTKTGDNDSAYQTRANTKKNKGSSEYPNEVLARMSSQERSEEEMVQDGVTAVIKKNGGKTVMWKTPLESHQEHAESQEETQTEQKPKKLNKPELGMAKKAPKAHRQPKEEVQAPAEEVATDTTAEEPKPKPKGKVTFGPSRIAKPAANKPAKKTVSHAAEALGMVINGTPAKPQRVTRSRTRAKAGQK